MTWLRWRTLAELSIAIIIALAFLFYLRAGAPVGRDVSGSNIAQDIMERAKIPGDGATVALVVFSDYRCPACRRANAALQEALAPNDDVELIVREWPVFGNRSEELARIAIAAGYQDLHLSLHDALMRSADISDAEVARIFTNLGGDWPQLQRDLAERADDIEAELRVVERDARRLGLRGTPAYLTDTTLVEGAVSERQFARLLTQTREP